MSRPMSASTPCHCADSLVSGTIPSLLDALYFTSCCSCSSAYPIDRDQKVTKSHVILPKYPMFQESQSHVYPFFTYFKSQILDVFRFANHKNSPATSASAVGRGSRTQRWAPPPGNWTWGAMDFRRKNGGFSTKVAPKYWLKVEKMLLLGAS